MLAGLVKGIVGFAMPMVMVSLLSGVTTPELALAGLILPTLITNCAQAMRQGAHAAVASIYRFRVYLLVGGFMLLLSAQLVLVLPIAVLLGLIGVPVVGFAVLQLFGVQFRLSGQSVRTEASVGAFAGFLGGMSGIWGPPTVMYLTALGTEKSEQMRAQGVIYGLGAVGLLGAHISSGVLHTQAALFSAALVVPALFGQWLGGRFLDRVDQVFFRRATLVVLLVAGLNLIRRAVFG
ncbi:MAG: sulfite exporter TauE/SafE family protein [Pseudomonadota bacterium]